MWSKVEISISCQAKIVIYEWSKMQQKSNLNLSEPTFDLCYNPTNYKSNILTFIWRFEIRHRPFNSKGTKTNFYLSFFSNAVSTKSDKLQSKYLIRQNYLNLQFSYANLCKLKWKVHTKFSIYFSRNPLRNYRNANCAV